jgi:hypothetical protein
VCQVHTAINAIVRSWSLDPISRDRWIEHTAEILQYYQRRNAQARASHTASTRHRLRQQSIRLASLEVTGSSTS